MASPLTAFSGVGPELDLAVKESCCFAFGIAAEKDGIAGIATCWVHGESALGDEDRRTTSKVALAILHLSIHYCCRAFGSFKRMIYTLSTGRRRHPVVKY